MSGLDAFVATGKAPRRCRKHRSTTLADGKYVVCSRCGHVLRRKTPKEVLLTEERIKRAERAARVTIKPLRRPKADEDLTDAVVPIKYSTEERKEATRRSGFVRSAGGRMNRHFIKTP